MVEAFAVGCVPRGPTGAWGGSWAFDAFDSIFFEEISNDGGDESVEVISVKLAPKGGSEGVKGRCRCVHGKRLKAHNLSRLVREADDSRT